MAVYWAKDQGRNHFQIFILALNTEI
ncbi:hypothetical protein DFAR_3320006 [Desulfarculales bacterium]